MNTLPIIPATFCSKDDLIRMEPNGNVALVSIRNAGAEAIDTPDGFHRSILVEFDDVDVEDREDAGKFLDKWTGEMIFAFLDGIASRCDEIVFQCDEGLSKSASMCAAYLAATGQDYMKIIQDPNVSFNRYVFSMASWCFKYEVPYEEVDKLFHVNLNSFIQYNREREHEIATV